MRLQSIILPMVWKYKQVCGFVGHPMANKNGVILEHRLVMSKYLGRFLEKHEVVHHKNGDATDNRIENLVLTNQSEHMKKFHPKQDGKTKIKCAFCGEAVLKPTRNIKFKKSHGQEDFYCGRSCAGSHFGKSRHKT